jgi:ABC-type polysaccharide/polyol phosphate export permease
MAVASSRSVAVPGNLWRDMVESFRNPDFWASSSWLGIMVRARKSRLGMVWLLAKSVVYVFGMGSFFGSMRTVGGSDASMGDFFAHVGLGMMVFGTMMSAITGSANAFVSGKAFILDGHLRLTDYLLQVLAQAFFDMCLYLPVVAIALWMAGGVAPLGWLTALPALLLVYLNSLWIAALFAVLGARLPDLGNMVATASIFAFILTPVIWYPAMMPAGSIRAALMHFNPLFHFVEIFRAPILDNTISITSVLYVAIFTVSGLLVSTLVYRRYARFVPLWI